MFTLEAQEGRLFHPLAYTKTFAMGFAALSVDHGRSVTHGAIGPGQDSRAKSRNPLSRVLIAGYGPIARLSLSLSERQSSSSRSLDLIATLPTFMKLGSEFMPPLYEGTLMYMPVTLPGASITEMQQLLQVTNRIIRQFPEVEQCLWQRPAAPGHGN